MEQWNKETKLSTMLAGVKEEYETITKLLQDELVERDSLIAQLRQLDVSSS